jgi:hypothetical protein
MDEICRVCKSKNIKKVFEARLLQYDVSYFECETCLYVQTEKPYWLEQAYSSAISGTDTGIVERNYKCAKRATNVCALLNIQNQPIVDHAGGYGLFVRSMRDIGFNTFWQDKYCQNLFARGFEYEKKKEKVALLTAFEVFEHLDEPLENIHDMFEQADNILFSTLLIPEPTPKAEDWWYYCRTHGQHIGFYRKKTLMYLAKKYNKNLYSCNSEIHLFSEKKISNVFYMALMKFYNLFFIFTKRRVSSKIWNDYFEIEKRNVR